MAESTEVSRIEPTTTYLEWRAKITKRLAGHMAALIHYEQSEKGETGDHEYALRREETKIARAKLQGVSKMIYDWSSLTEDSTRLLLAEINEALEDAEKEVFRVV